MAKQRILGFRQSGAPLQGRGARHPAQALAMDGAAHPRLRALRGACTFGLLLLLTLFLVACGSPEERAANYMRKAQELYDEGDYTAAKLEAQNAAQIAPKDAQAHYLLAQIAEKQQEFRIMIQRLLMAVDSDPNMVAARAKLGTLYFFGQAYEQSQEQADAAKALAPDDPEVRVLNARLLLHNDKRDDSIAELDAALAANPDLLDAIILRAGAEALEDPSGGLEILDTAIARLDLEQSKVLRQIRIAILAQQDRKEDVEQGFRDLIRDYPQEEEFQYELARFYAGQGRVDEAEQVMRGVVAQAPQDVTARLGLAQFLAQMRSPEAAEKALEAFVAENPNQPELRAALGRLYEANQKPDAALAVYQELAKRDPKSKPGVAARVRVAALLIGKEQFDEGGELIDGVLVDEPENAEALLIRAGLKVRDRKFDDAVADMRTVLRKEPENDRAMLLLARTHGIMNERVLAKDAYRRLLAVDPKNFDAARELAALEAMDGNVDGAEEILRARLKVEPNDLDAASRLVFLLGSQKAWKEAEAEARRISTLPGDAGMGDFQLGRLYRAQDKNQEAVASFRAALEKNPSWPLALEGLVGTLNAMGRNAEALEILREYRSKYPEDLAAKYMEGSLLAGSDDKTAAEKLFSEIVAQKPDASMAWVALANLNPDDPAARIADYKRGLAANPGNPEIGLLLGTEYEKAKRYEEAIAHYQELLRANPSVDVAVNNLAALLLDQRSDPASHAKALELMKPLESTSNPAVLDTIGWAYYRNKDYPTAVRYLERAVAGAGQFAVLRYHLGMAYLANSNTEGAKDQLKRAVNTPNADFPGIVEARATLKKLDGGA